MFGTIYGIFFTIFSFCTLVKIVLFSFFVLPKASSSVHTMFEAHLSLLTAGFNAFSCQQWEPTGSLPWGKATLRKNKQSSACTWWLQMFHVDYINYDSKIAHLLNKFFNKNSMLLQKLGNVLTCRFCYVFKSMQISCSGSKRTVITINTTVLPLTTNLRL